MPDVRRSHSWLLAPAAAAALLGCASADEGARPRPPAVKAGEFGTPACFLRQNVRNFQILDDRNLIVYTPGRSDAYHVQVSPPEMDLREAEVLGFSSRGAQVCGYAGDEIVAGAHGVNGRRLSVTGVYRLDAIALQGLEARFGRGVAPGPSGTAPKPGEGAAIEHELGSGTP